MVGTWQWNPNASYTYLRNFILKHNNQSGKTIEIKTQYSSTILNFRQYHGKYVLLNRINLIKDIRNYSGDNTKNTHVQYEELSVTDISDNENLYGEILSEKESIYNLKPVKDNKLYTQPPTIVLSSDKHSKPSELKLFLQDQFKHTDGVKSNKRLHW